MGGPAGHFGTGCTLDVRKMYDVEVVDSDEPLNKAKFPLKRFLNKSTHRFKT